MCLWFRRTTGRPGERTTGPGQSVDLTSLVGVYDRVPALLLILVRVGAMLFTAPVLGGPQVPPTVKALLTLAISVLLVPGTAPLVVAVDGRFALLVICEFLLGMSIGFIVSLIFHGVRMGGEFINRHAGFSAAENFDPEADFGAGPMGDLFHIMLVLAFFAADGHLWFIALISRSFEAVPIGAWSLTPAFATLLEHGMADMWRISLAISFPVLTAVLLLTMAEGVMTRAIPQINVLHISFAIKILVSVAVLYAAMPAAVAFLGTCLVMAQRFGLAALTACH